MKRNVTFFILTMLAMFTWQHNTFADDEIWVGARSNNVYKYNWLATAAGHNDICGGFYSEMVSYNYSNIIPNGWHNLGNGTEFVEGNDGGTYGIDNNDFFMTCTHGGIESSPDIFTLGMYNTGYYADSDNMRLGDDGRGLSVFATFSCNLMSRTTTSTSNMWNRWKYIFKGGLRIASGFTNSANSVLSLGAGKRYAEELHVSGRTIVRAWAYVMDDYGTQDPTSIVTQKNCSNCNDQLYACGWRMNGMTISNFKTYPKLADNDVSSYCYYAVTP